MEVDVMARKICVKDMLVHTVATIILIMSILCGIKVINIIFEKIGG